MTKKDLPRHIGLSFTSLGVQTPCWLITEKRSLGPVEYLNGKETVRAIFCLSTNMKTTSSILLCTRFCTLSKCLITE
jgi:hypothetical protein